MLVVDGDVVWSASDLTAASQCEYGVLRALDKGLGRIDALAADDDPLLAHIADLGDRHEAAVLTAMRRAGRSVTVLPRAEANRRAELLAMHARTLAAFDEKPDVVFQAGFFDGSFLGYADFVERVGDTWLVSDAKLARQARPKALLQVAAYAEQLARAGLPVAPEGALELGSGERQTFALDDVLPVFVERRARLLAMLEEHRADDGPLEFDDPRFASCGRCAECAAAIADRRDLLLVAGVRVDQRLKLREQGLSTVADLAAAGAGHRPPGMAPATFEKLVAQAALQQRQLDAGVDENGQPRAVFVEPTPMAGAVLSTLPAPSAGDVFFDFEGDPLYVERDLTLWGLEYLWGALEVDGTFRPWWADDRDGEREALESFMRYLLERRRAYPDLHVYHYAAYERSALLRLTRRYHRFEDELDDLLRDGVLVDLYATVRGAVRISQPSYSIKKLEPFYMPKRSGSDVTAGDASIVAYHEYREHRDRGELAEAQARREAITEYNRLDCVSTRLLRDWLLDQPDAPTFSGPPAVPGEPEVTPPDEVFTRLMSFAGPLVRAERTGGQQAFAMLAEARGYYRRENAPFYWEHFERLGLPVEYWRPQRDVFQVLDAEVVEDWNVPAGKRNHFRRVRLTGEWGPGSTPKTKAAAVYGEPVPPGVDVPERSMLGTTRDFEIVVGDDESQVELVETAPADARHDALPQALVPARPPSTEVIEAAMAALTAEAADGVLPDRAAIDLLLRRPPRLRPGSALPHTGSVVDDAVAALLGMDDSYVAVQGPPGTGKTWTGARVIRRLVEEHGWRIGVVAQSHSVIEHLLDGVIEAGLEPGRVGKIRPETPGAGRISLRDNAAARAFVDDSSSSGGCVFGGTVWAYASRDLADAELDLLVVDEAGQFALAPTMAASAAAKRLLLLGDPQQLPQVSKGVHAEPVDASALGWLMDSHDTMPPELGYFLADTYRMHPALAERVSALSYEGRLSAHPCTAERRLEGVEPGLQVVRLEHTQRGSESPEEADEVVAQVRRLVGTTWHAPPAAPRPLTLADVLVVAPYNAQVHLIRKRLAAAGFGAVQVGTVDKFQGREAPVTIISMTASSQGDVPRGMGFLLDRNRVNVAASRAQWLTVLIRSSALTAYMPTSTKGLLELGAFIRLTEIATFP
ncbi:TM0106 family RecB-like putative nuclease [Spongisporangium articulatum]|uniref:TM0106 family RecB-like putative nuclease n=1 Tax=Spongisporangium articulatum TaxID=3362603 RepID=A0ABW8AL40_9ACTN